MDTAYDGFMDGWRDAQIDGWMDGEMEKDDMRSMQETTDR